MKTFSTKIMPTQYRYAGQKFSSKLDKDDTAGVHMLTYRYVQGNPKAPGQIDDQTYLETVKSMTERIVLRKIHAQASQTDEYLRGQNENKAPSLYAPHPPQKNNANVSASALSEVEKQKGAKAYLEAQKLIDQKPKSGNTLNIQG